MNVKMVWFGESYIYIPQKPCWGREGELISGLVKLFYLPVHGEGGGYRLSINQSSKDLCIYTSFLYKQYFVLHDCVC